MKRGDKQEGTYYPETHTAYLNVGDVTVRLDRRQATIFRVTGRDEHRRTMVQVGEAASHGLQFPRGTFDFAQAEKFAESLVRERIERSGNRILDVRVERWTIFDLLRAVAAHVHNSTCETLTLIRDEQPALRLETNRHLRFVKLINKMLWTIEIPHDIMPIRYTIPIYAPSARDLLLRNEILEFVEQSLRM